MGYTSLGGACTSSRVGAEVAKDGGDIICGDNAPLVVRRRNLPTMVVSLVPPGELQCCTAQNRANKGEGGATLALFVGGTTLATIYDKITIVSDFVLQPKSRFSP